MIQGDGTKLYYYNFSIELNVLKTIIFSVSLAALFILLMGSWLQKMVGLEYVFLLQLVYYSHFGLPSYKECFGIFQYLAPASLN